MQTPIAEDVEGVEGIEERLWENIERECNQYSIRFRDRYHHMVCFSQRV